MSAGRGEFASLLENAAEAGNWPLSGTNAFDPWDEIDRQQAVHEAAIAIAELARDLLCGLADRSRAYSRYVRCDQEDWSGIIADTLDDMVGETFACLPDAVARARREATSGDESS